MQSKPYPEEKKRILIERSRTDFVAFLDEVTDHEGEAFIRNQLLPRNIPGFRGGNAPRSLTVPRLITRLRNEQELTNSDSPIWNSFKNAWKFWIRSHRELKEILLEFDNKADFDENDACVEPPNSELDIQCFKILLEASSNDKIDQETIQRFYDYGYFNKNEQIQDLINKALPREEIERRQRIKELPDQVDRLSQEIEGLRSQVSSMEPSNELEQVLDQQITEIQESFENKLRALDQQIKENQQSIENQSSGSNFTQTVSLLRQLVNSLESRIVKLENSLSDIQPTTNEYVNNVDNTVSQLAQQIQNTRQFVEGQLDEVNSAIAEIESMVVEQNQTTRVHIADRASEIGRDFETKLATESERYGSEQQYLDNLELFQRRFRLTNSKNMDDSEEIAVAVHIALKAFPALEVADERIINIWKLICGNHLHVTKIHVEMGWLGFQDWFPDFFADECFDERLGRIDLNNSIRKMLEIGDMSWAIHFCNCDRSYPEVYLPQFLDWISKFGRSSIRVFLTRCSGSNHCVTGEDVYERVAPFTQTTQTRTY